MSYVEGYFFFFHIFFCIPFSRCATHDRVGAIFYIINMAEQNNVEFVLRRKFCLLFFYIFLFIFRFAGQMHAELFEDALIYRGKQDGGMNLASF